MMDEMQFELPRFLSNARNKCTNQKFQFTETSVKAGYAPTLRTSLHLHSKIGDLFPHSLLVTTPPCTMLSEPKVRTSSVNAQINHSCSSLSALQNSPLDGGKNSAKLYFKS